ncbi:succinate-semialdehyde dehydrogenase/glutarate-semialdehyde dehydrogenase [Kibdelosporangium banguiense]|uniref:Succinate-semialdehyde dehydrogenase/glutarate-semialdehyde dehydrogenase n=1 Tax=Kibdelosporangium banguiense TaxID=1365924 RepID=A0ABS4TPB8_9PSEU|nr:NADP-dependent succinic semialdehyde dehydrogenase [Kibdelosporangium banguiense]MBP2326247.1 succinate-semialdehyde dehydrogenase/glutarate-semialdehyde dehydrogenase [Kibdelosporangium banguiense]
MAIATINPATGQTVDTFKAFAPAEIDARIARAAEAFTEYRRTTFAQRAEWMRAAAGKVDAASDEIAKIMTLEMGKPIKQAAAEAAKCAAAMRFYADNAEKFLADTQFDPQSVSAGKAYIRWQPIGPVLAIMPWNFPFWQVVRFAAPALMAGNVCLLKHASNVPKTALRLQDVFLDAGFPPDAFQTLLVGSDAIEQILTDARVVAVTLTGSEAAGRSVAAIAGREIKKSVLELGGSDPFIVMPSADLAKAAEVATTARCQNNGQSCIAAKRFIVHAEVMAQFQDLFVENMSALRVGDPADDRTDVGPLATEQGRRDIEEQIEDAVGKGATVLCGGKRADGAGWFYHPTVITGITREMRMYGEEVFGPVAQLYPVADIEEAIRLANDTSFGLGSNAWTGDPGEQRRFISELDAGQVFVNGMTTSYPALPFGGVKSSGYGRELADLGIREFCNAKTVWIG